MDGGESMVQYHEESAPSHIDIYFYISLITSLLLVSKTIPTLTDVIIYVVRPVPFPGTYIPLKNFDWKLL